MTQLLLLASILTFSANAQVPEPTITTMSSSYGHATIAGRLSSKPSAPTGISVRNGNLMYSTLTDFEGRWGIVIRHQSVNVSVESWDMTKPFEKSRTINVKILRNAETENE